MKRRQLVRQKEGAGGASANSAERNLLSLLRLHEQVRLSVVRRVGMQNRGCAQTVEIEQVVATALSGLARESAANASKFQRIRLLCEVLVLRMRTACLSCQRAQKRADELQSAEAADGDALADEIDMLAEVLVLCDSAAPAPTPSRRVEAFSVDTDPS